MDNYVSKDEQPRIRFLRRVIVGVLITFIASLGLPLWFTTTTIYRADLPNEEIASLSSNLKDNLHFQIPIYLDLPEAQDSIVSQVQSSVNDRLSREYPVLQNFWSLQIENGKGKDVDPVDNYIIKGQSGKDASAAASYAISPYNKETILFTSAADPNIDQVIVSILFDGIFKEELTTFSKLLLDDNNKHNSIKNSALVLPYSSKYNVVLSLFTESGQPIEWEIAEISKLFSPIFDSLSHVANFSISSQIQYYSKLTIEPTFNADKKVYEIQQDDLSTFINFEDWNLNSHDITPTINFVVYFPESNYKGKQLKIQDSKTNSFLVPQWGGVYIFNKDKPLLSDKTTKIVSSELLPIMETFASQLFQLVGMASSPKSLNIRIDSISRIVTFKNIRQSLENLMSLVKVTISLDEISIPELTKESVETSIKYINEAISKVNNDHDFKLSVQNSARGVEYSNKAFFEKEMVQQAYFPSEHRLAVFLPLLGPITSILVLGIIKTVKEMRADKKKTE